MGTSPAAASVTTDMPAHGAPESPNLAAPRLRRRTVLLVVLASLAVYLPTLSGFPLADDFQLMTRRIVWRDLGSWMLPQMGHLRPIQLLVLHAQGAWFGLSTLPTHALMLLLHVGCALLVGRLAQRASGNAGAGLLAALFFALHPVHPSTVAWMSASADGFCAFFALASLVAYETYASTGRRSGLLLSLGLFVLALGSKEEALALPLLVAAWEVVIRRRWRAPGVLALLAVVAGYMAFRFHLIGGLGGRMDGMGGSEHLDFGFFDLLRGLFVSPLRPLLTPVNEEWWGGAARPLQAFLALVLLAAAAACVQARRVPSRAAVLLGLVFVLLAVLPFATLMSRGFLPSLANGRMLYLPSAGLCIALGAVLAGLPSTRLARALPVAVAVAWGAVALGNALAWRETAAVSRAIAEGVAEARPSFGVRRPVLVVEDVPRMHAGNYLYLSGNDLAAAVRMAHEPCRVVRVDDEVWGLWVDLRSFFRPRNLFVMRWDAEARRMVDRTDDYRRHVLARGPREAGESLVWEGADLDAWTSVGAARITEGDAVVLSAKKRAVRLESPPLPPTTRGLRVEVAARGVDVMPLRFRWSVAGDEHERNYVRVRLRANGKFATLVLETPTRRVDELDAEALHASLSAVLVEGELLVRRIEAFPVDAPTDVEQKNRNPVIGGRGGG